jgi:HNH endonuclease
MIQVTNPSRHGYSIMVQPPNAIPGISASVTSEPAIDPETVDFFRGRRFVRALLERQGGRCFYSLCTLDEQNCELDHLQPQANALNNSYRNIVCCSFEMNKRKGHTPADAFLRQLYRSGFLSAEELDERLSLLSRIQSDELKPKI